MKEEVEAVETPSEQEYSKKDKIKYALIYSGLFLLMPTAIGIPLTAIFQNGYIVETVYVAFGAMSILIALFRSRRRDTKNIRKTHTVVEDKDTPSYRQYSFQQLIAYISGAVAIGLGVAAFYICIAIGLIK